MPGYDSKLDERLFSKSWETDSERITVSVYAYNKGAKKLQISRENRGPEGEYIFAKLGRLSKDEIGGILPLISEALKYMD